MKAFLLLLSPLFLSACSSFFYYPAKVQFYAPARVNLTEESVTFKDAFSNEIHAWWFAAKKQPALGTFVFFHGNAENISTHFLALHWLPDAGYNYLIFDYPGYGKSSGKPDQQNTVAAGVAALEWVHQHKDPRPLIVYGQSLGGNVALRSCELVHGKIPLQHLVIEGSFPNYKAMANKVLRRSWITWLLSPLAYVLVSNEGAPKNISALSPTPLLLIHGENDNVVEPAMSEKIFDLAAQPKQIWLIPGGVHGDTYFREGGKYRQKLLDYLKNFPAAK